VRTPATVIALLGAESTGKTSLCAELSPRLAELTGLRCSAVSEPLRHWCDAMGRTPRREEQADIAAMHQKAIDAAAREHELVVCDTTPLMVAVYSQLLFDDTSLLPAAIAWQQRCSHTLLMALDIPWVADGFQRDGEHVRAPVDALLRTALIEHALPWSLVSGAGAVRVERALDALAPLLRRHLRQRLPGASSGLFTRLAERNAQPSAARWYCEHCDDPGCEHLEQARRRGAAA
jgi:nicotinamide riboside kinase